MHLPSISTSAQTALLVLLCLGHVIALLLYLVNFPFRCRTKQIDLIKSIKHVAQTIRFGRKKQADEESIPSIQTERPHYQPRVPSQTLRPRWPFQSSISSVLSPRSSTWDASATSTGSIRTVYHNPSSDVKTKTVPLSTSTPLTKYDAEPETAYTTSVSLSPYPTVTPTPIRRFMRADASYSPSIYPPLSNVKMDRGVEMLSPSVYSPLPLNVGKRRGNERLEETFVDGDGSAIAGAAVKGSEDGYVDDCVRSQELLTPVARPVRPSRSFDPGRRFETSTPESLEKGSIVIGLGGGLSPLVGTDVIAGHWISASRSGEELGLDRAAGGMSGAYIRPLATKTTSKGNGERVQLKRFATPLTDEDVEEGNVQEADQVSDIFQGLEQSQFPFHFMDHIVASIASSLAKMLDDGHFSTAEDNLLVKTGDLPIFLAEN